MPCAWGPLLSSGILQIGAAPPVSSSSVMNNSQRNKQQRAPRPSRLSRLFSSMAAPAADVAVLLTSQVTSITLLQIARAVAYEAIAAGGESTGLPTRRSAWPGRPSDHSRWVRKRPPAVPVSVRSADRRREEMPQHLRVCRPGVPFVLADGVAHLRAHLNAGLFHTLHKS
jgi:hypothetical protein